MISLSFAASILLVIKGILCATGLVPRILPDPIALVVSEDSRPFGSAPVAEVRRAAGESGDTAPGKTAAQPVKVAPSALPPGRALSSSSSARRAPHSPASASGPLP